MAPKTMNLNVIIVFEIKETFKFNEIAKRKEVQVCFVTFCKITHYISAAVESVGHHMGSSP